MARESKDDKNARKAAKKMDKAEKKTDKKIDKLNKNKNLSPSEKLKRLLEDD